MTEYSSGDNKKTVWITVIAGVVVLGALIWWMNQARAPEEVVVSPTPDAETATINQDIDSIEVGDLNAEFDAIDADLQGL